MDIRTIDLSPSLELARERRLVGLDGRDLRRPYARGDHTRLRRGIYVPSTTWEELDDDARYLLRIQSVVLSRASRPVLSHFSAARMWGLPIVGRWPDHVHLMVRGTATRDSKDGIVWHHDALDDDDVVELDGFLVTSRLRTMIDIARSTSFVHAVAVLDAGLRPSFQHPSGRQNAPTEKAELHEAVQRLGSSRGSRMARAAALFADAQSGSTGESVSRANIYIAGFPAPALQVRYRSPEGPEDIVDFVWEAQQSVHRLPLLGEFDGKIKYTRAQYMLGKPIEEVVWAEKVREDRLRRPGRTMVRWLWATAMRPDKLRAVLLEAGLRPNS